MTNAGVLVILSLVIAFIGLAVSTQVSIGAGLAGVACLFGIFARLAQASAQHRRVMEALEELSRAEAE